MRIQQFRRYRCPRQQARGADVDERTGVRQRGGGKTVEVTATEFMFHLPTTHFTPGTYTFVMKDTGKYPHTMEVDGPGVSDMRAALADPGGTTSLTVTLQKGTYEFYCPVDGHRAMGMQTMLSVG